MIAGVGGTNSGQVTAFGDKTANDFAYFYGSSGATTFVASGSADSYMIDAHRFNVAAGFGDVQVFSGGSQNVAYFWDSPGNDVFYGSTAVSFMYGPGYINEAAGFALVYAESFLGGVDYAYNLDPNQIITSGFAAVFA